MSLVYLLAGETSGDVLGARLITALRRARPHLEFHGVGGPRMAEQGLRSLFPMQDLAVMGLLEVAPSLRNLRRRLEETVGDIGRRRPACVVTIDSPGFMLRLLHDIRSLGIPRAHYVAPQVWAWREGRVRRFPGLWERLLCLLPFEPAYFARHGLAASFVGHPVLESGADRGNAARFRASRALSPDTKLITLMPGSRPSEVARLLPIFGHALGLLADRVPGLVPAVPVVSAVAPAVEQAASNWPIRPLIVSDLADKHDCFAASSVALTKSGTSTLELALAGVPMAVAYRVNPITAAVVRRLVKVRYASIMNLLAEREIVPELLQANCTPERLAATLAPLLTNANAAEAQRQAFRDVLRKLAVPNASPSDAAAAAILGMLDQA